MKMHPQAVWPNAFSIPNVWAFDLVSYSWSSLPDLPDHRAGGGAAVLGTQLHFFGGGQSRPWSEFYADSRLHWAIDLDNMASGWQEKAPISVGRNHLGGIAYKGRLYCFGGQLGTDEYTLNQDIAEVYDPFADRWTTLEPMIEPLGHITPGIFASPHGIFILGGTGNRDRRRATTLLFYSPERDEWVRMSAAVAEASQVAGIIDNQIYSQANDQAYRAQLEWHAW